MDLKSIRFKNNKFNINLMKNTNTFIIVVLILLLISNLFFGYMFFFHKSGPDFNRGNFQQMQLTDEQIQSITSLFESTSDTNEITDYCNNNRMECFYYCREINPNHEYCSQLMQGRSNFQRQDSQQVQRLN